MRGIATVIMLCAVQLLSAQIRIIPKEKLLEVAEPKAVASSLRFLVEQVNFGTIDEMSSAWQGRAMLTNVGTDTIVLSRIKTTCGCLRADVPTRVIAPKQSVAMTLKYYPRGHAGNVMQRVLVYAGSEVERPSAILQVRGVVTASADRSDDYPYTRGALRLRQEVVQFAGTEREVQRIACMNGGSTELRPVADTLLTSRGLKVRFEPQILAPKQEGDMVIEYLPKGVDSDNKGLKIYLKLPGVSPRNGIIEVTLRK